MRNLGCHSHNIYNYAHSVVPFDSEEHEVVCKEEIIILDMPENSFGNFTG